jgi:subtilase family serine protease
MKLIIYIYFFALTFFNVNAYLNVKNDTVLYTIALKQNNVDYLKKALLYISNPSSIGYGKYLTKDQILNISKAKDSDVEIVTDWLKKYNTDYYNLGDALLCKSTLNNLQDMFNIKIKKLKNNRYYVLNEYKIPEYLKLYIDFVEGINNKNYNRYKVNTINNNINAENGYASREVINRLYNITYNVIKNESSIGSIEYQGDSGFSKSDLKLSQTLNNENIKYVSNNHIVGYDAEESDTETQLDMQMMSQVAENVELWFWDENQWLYSFAVNFFNKTDIPDVISMSWGWAEYDQCSITTCNNITASQYINRVNTEYIKIGLRGVTILVSSGDAGAPGRTNEGCDENSPLNPDFPGSSPWITSVGGTFIVDDNSKDVKWNTTFCKENKCLNSKKEMVSNYKYTGWTSGGGFSIYSSELIPIWQRENIYDYLNSNVPLPKKFNENGRGYPDVTAISHNCAIIDNSEITGVDGTSCSSPTFAGIIALLNDFQKNRGKHKLGFINPLLYKMAESYETFNDFTEGNNWCTENTCCPVRLDEGSNFGYTASKGWDPVYGLGSPNVGNMLEWLRVNT